MHGRHVGTGIYEALSFSGFPYCLPGPGRVTTKPWEEVNQESPQSSELHLFCRKRLKLAGPEPLVFLGVILFIILLCKVQGLGFAPELSSLVLGCLNIATETSLVALGFPFERLSLHVCHVGWEFCMLRFLNIIIVHNT